MIKYVIHSLIKSWYDSLVQKYPGGEWRTIHGHHVYVNKQGHIAGYSLKPNDYKYGGQYTKPKSMEEWHKEKGLKYEKENIPLEKEHTDKLSPKKEILLKELQKISDGITKLYNVPAIPIKISALSPHKHEAGYVTHQYKSNGVTSKKKYPQYIILYHWNDIKTIPREINYQLSHELAHHIDNMNGKNITHSDRFCDLWDTIEEKLNERLK